MLQIVWWVLVTGAVMMPGVDARAYAAGVALPRHEPPVRVRVHEVAAAGAWDIDRSLREATGLVGAAGVQSQWTRCTRRGSPSPGPAATCGIPAGPLTPVLRLVRAADPPAPGDLVLGFSLIDASTRTGVFGTVFLDRVEQLAVLWHLPVETLLARAMAHEIGHLLLGSSRHSREGLMQARWSQRMLLAQAPDDWRFSPSDARRLRDAVTRRSAVLEARARPPLVRAPGATN